MQLQGLGTAGIVVSALDEFQLGLQSSICLHELSIFLLFVQVGFSLLFNNFQSCVHVSLLCLNSSFYFSEQFILVINFLSSYVPLFLGQSSLFFLMRDFIKQSVEFVTLLSEFIVEFFVLVTLLLFFLDQFSN